MVWFLIQRVMQIKQSRDLGDTPRTHIHGCRKYREQTWSWSIAEQEVAKRIIQTDYMNEGATAMWITVNQQRVLLTSAFFRHSGYADRRVERAHRAIEKHTKSKKSNQIVGGDFNSELEFGIGVEWVIVGPHTLKEKNKRGAWMKQWLVPQKFVAQCTEKRM